jgi:hypothetical protein
MARQRESKLRTISSGDRWLASAVRIRAAGSRRRAWPPRRRRVAGRVEPALASQYENPLEGLERIRNRICFFNERIDLMVDGELQERPRTRWSTTEWLHDTYVDERGTRRTRPRPAR